MEKKLLVTAFAALLGMPAVAAAADLGQARGAVSQMEQASTQVTNLLNNAKASNDAIKFSCLNDKATQIKTLVRDANAGLGKATGLAGAAQEQAIASILADAETVEGLRTAAAECVGVAEAEEAKADESKKERAQLEQINLLDPTQSATSVGSAPTPSLPAVQQPAPASPTR